MYRKKPSKYEMIETINGYYGYIEASYDASGKLVSVYDMRSLAVIENSGEFIADVVVFPETSQENAILNGITCKFVTEIPEDNEKLKYFVNVLQRTAKMFRFFQNLSLAGKDGYDENGEWVGIESEFEDPKFPKGYMHTLGGRFACAVEWMKHIKGEENNAKKENK